MAVRLRQWTILSLAALTAPACWRAPSTHPPGTGRRSSSETVTAPLCYEIGAGLTPP